MTSPIDTQYVLSDPDITPYYKDEMHDLTGDNVPLRGPGEFIVFEEVIPKTQVLVVKGISPYVLERTNIDTPNESAQYIPPRLVERFITFEPYINDNSPHLIDNNFAQFQVLGGPPPTSNDAIRERARGFSAVSDEPYQVAIRQWYSSLYTFIVRGNSRLRIIFRVLPVGAGFSTYQIGGGGGAIGEPPKRIDYAGSIVVGMRMPEQLYNNMIEKRRRENGA